MQRRHYKPIWLLLALFFTGQSLLPVAAFAQVSVRCVGAPASSAPCAQGTFATANAAAISEHFATVACCRMMAHCSMLAAGNCAQSPVPGTSSLSATKCVVSVNLLNTKPATLGLQAHRWLLWSAPALAPPARAVSLIPAKSSLATLFPTGPFSLPVSVSTHSHGLRAPPVA